LMSRNTPPYLNATKCRVQENQRASRKGNRVLL
jgi:hypothetical protein